MQAFSLNSSVSPKMIKKSILGSYSVIFEL